MLKVTDATGREHDFSIANDFLIDELENLIIRRKEPTTNTDPQFLGLFAKGWYAFLTWKEDDVIDGQ